MAFIYDAVRTPRGKGNKDGAFAPLKPDELISTLVDAVMQRIKSEIQPDALVLGAVGQVGAQGGRNRSCSITYCC